MGRQAICKGKLPGQVATTSIDVCQKSIRLDQVFGVDERPQMSLSAFLFVWRPLVSLATMSAEPVSRCTAGLAIARLPDAVKVGAVSDRDAWPCLCKNRCSLCIISLEPALSDWLFVSLQYRIELDPRAEDADGMGTSCVSELVNRQSRSNWQVQAVEESASFTVILILIMLAFT